LIEKSVYVVSDLHLGAPNPEASLIREKHFVNWLDTVQSHTQALYLLGDIFDFWFEYKRSVPRGYIRLLGKLANFTDQGIPVHIFSGNHDLWYQNYLPQQINATVHHEPLVTHFFGKKYYLAHGDGLGPGDHGYKFMKRVVTHPISKWLYRQLHPDWGIGFAYFFSNMSRKYKNPIQSKAKKFYGENEYLLIHAREILQDDADFSYFVFGHRHILKEIPLNTGATCFFLGDWINHFSYLQIAPHKTQLATFPLTETATSLSKQTK